MINDKSEGYLELRFHLLVDLLNIVLNQLHRQSKSTPIPGRYAHLSELEGESDSARHDDGKDLLGQPTTRPAESPASADLGIMWK